MFEIKNGNIYVSRGDAFALNIPVVNEDGAEYILHPLEKLRFDVYDIDSHRTISEIYSEGGSTRIEVDGKESLRWHDRLGFDIKLIYGDGSEDTIIGTTPTRIPRIYVMEVGV